MSATIPTPVTAVVAGTLDQADLEKGRVGLAIIDNPIKPDKTYIVFDAVAGNNNLHLDTGVSTTYSINKGDGTVDDSHTDTGGVKILNYTVTGRYTITIDGNFAGIDTSQTVVQTDLNKYIQIIAGSNHPTSLVLNAFKNCIKLQYATFTELITIGNTAFSGCSLIQKGTFPKVTSIGTNAFLNCPLIIVLIKDIVSIMSSNMGVGTLSAAKRLVVSDTTTTCEVSIISSNTGFASILFGRENDSIRASIAYDNNTDILYFRSNDNNNKMTLLANGYLGVNTIAPTERIEADGNIKASGDIIALGDVFCDDLECLNVNAAGNVEGQTISENGTLLDDKYVKPGDTVNFAAISEGGVALDSKYVKPNDNVDFGDIVAGAIECSSIQVTTSIEGQAISENGTLLANKYYKDDTLPEYDQANARYEFASLGHDRKPLVTSAFNMGATSQVVDLSDKINYSDTILLTSSAAVDLRGLSFNSAVIFGEKIYIFNDGSFNITLVDGSSTFNFEMDSSFILKPDKWVMIMFPPKTVGTNKWTVFPSA